jgi:hypothetical protein
MGQDWPKYLLIAFAVLWALLIGYLIADQTGGYSVQETVRATQIGHSEAWTQHQDTHVPLDDHGGEMTIPQTIEWPESWTFNLETAYGIVAATHSQPDAARLLCCRYVQAHYRVGRWSKSPIGVSVGEEAIE